MQIVKDGAARFGATTASVFMDQPGNKDLAISGPGGVEFEFGTAKQTIFSAKSDCRMRATDTPTPPPPRTRRAWFAARSSRSMRKGGYLRQIARESAG